MQEWIDERCYQVGDAGAAIAGDEPEGDGEDQEDGRWRGFWGSFLVLEYFFDSNIKTLSDRNQLNIIFYILFFILPKII